ncbi:MAG: hypothetical protein ACE5NL_00135 [Candidatus Hydrothermarchaeaceae archaeon]
MEKKIAVGIDLNGPKNPSAVAVLKGNQIYFDEWMYEESGNLMLPESASVIAIDGPMGFSEKPGQFRECERELGTPGKTYYSLDECRKPFLQLIEASTKLFWNLHRKGYRLYGLEENAGITLIEVWPLSGWRALFKPELKSRRYIPGGKGSLQGQRFMRNAIEKLGYKFTTVNPSAHHLDAAMAAITAQYFSEGKFERFGKKPRIDEVNKCIREGYIVAPE